jgi:microcystin-dependent protein
MANPYVAEIRVFPFNFPPKGWAFCDGQLMSISQNTALFSLLGTTYGGNGTSNFALPNMQGNCSMHPGQGPGLSLHDLGETGGAETITLLESEIPSHTHSVMADGLFATKTAAAGNSLAKTTSVGNIYDPTSAKQLNPNCVTPSGGSLPHNNMMPYLTLNWCIALQGVYPARS